MAESKIVGHSQDVKARPILMSVPMVKSCLREDDPKSQTRRIAKFLPRENGYFGFSPLEADKNGDAWVLSSMDGSCWNERSFPLRCPYGKPGDLLYVRESICVLYEEGESYDPMGGAGAEMGAAHGISYGMARTESIPYLAYAADGDYLLEPPEGKKDLQMRSCPSIHMPRWASRLTLRITDVRVERLHDITTEDAIAEGVETEEYLERQEYFDNVLRGCEATGRPNPRSGYEALWEKINGNGSWKTNSWVWVLTFDVIRKNVDEVLKDMANANR